MIWQDNLAKLVDRLLPFALDWLPQGSCLVGGAVRDALLNRRRDYLDLDLVLPCFAVETARKIANQFQGGFVVLDAKRQIARVVFEHGTVDFALQEGDSLEADLNRRDFTVNAIAYDLHRGQIFDPLDGRGDLERRCLRMLAIANLIDDPLRLLRAYRQAAQLDFTLDPDTQASLRKLAPLTGTVAAERVQSELNYLLAHRRGLGWLKTAWEDGVIAPWLATITTGKIESAIAIDPTATCLERKLGYDFLPHAQRLGKLACLVAEDADRAEQELLRLKYSRSEIRTISIALRSLPLLSKGDITLSLREQYLLFLAVGKSFPVFALVAIAKGQDPHQIAPLLKRHLDLSDPVAHPQSLITGKDLIDQLTIPPSPLVGRLLTSLQIAQVEGKIATADEAIAYARQLIESKNEGT
jgi:tRNA nucleotidyltransferase (CCA-adding enzyme)